MTRSESSAPASTDETVDDAQPTLGDPTDIDEAKDRYIVPGLVRGLQALKAFTPERPNLSLSEIAELLGTSRSAAFRTVYTLSHMGCLLHDKRTQTYALGPAVLRLGYGYLTTRELVEVAFPELERLRAETEWSAHMGVLDGTSVLYVLRLPAPHRLSSIVQVGSRLPARSTTMGRVLLADLDEPTLVSLYRSEAKETGNASPQTLSRRPRPRTSPNWTVASPRPSRGRRSGSPPCSAGTPIPTPSARPARPDAARNRTRRREACAGTLPTRRVDATQRSESVATRCRSCVLVGPEAAPATGRSGR